MGPLLDPHANTNRDQDTWTAEPMLPAPEDERPAEGQGLTPDAPHNGGRPPPPGGKIHAAVSRCRVIAAEEKSKTKKTTHRQKK